MIKNVKNLMLKKKFSNKNYNFFDQKLQYTYLYASIKDVQAAGEGFSPQKRTFSAPKH
jgi:hypothetical protein